MYKNPHERLSDIITRMRGDLVAYSQTKAMKPEVYRAKSSLIQQLEQVRDSIILYTQPLLWATAQQRLDDLSRTWGELTEVTLVVQPGNPDRPVQVRHYKRKNATRSPRISHLLQ